MIYFEKANPGWHIDNFGTRIAKILKFLGDRLKIDKETFVVYIQCHNYVKFHHICRNNTFFHLSGQILCGAGGNA